MYILISYGAYDITDTPTPSKKVAALMLAVLPKGDYKSILLVSNQVVRCGYLSVEKALDMVNDYMAIK